MKEIKDISIVFIGAGNLATNLAKSVHAHGMNIRQIYSRTKESAKILADVIGCPFTTDLGKVVSGADLYIVSLRDAALVEHLSEITAGKGDSLVVHTAGSLPMSLFEGALVHYGVLYPMQTFSKQKEVDFSKVPFFVEASDKESLELLKAFASALSPKVYEATSEQRQSLHLAAVFSCNFTNHMYALAYNILEKYKLPFDVLLPLIDETAGKVHKLSPKMAQTGPAIRNDSNVISNHLKMLKDDAMLKEIYELLTESIQEQQ